MITRTDASFKKQVMTRLEKQAWEHYTHDKRRTDIGVYFSELKLDDIKATERKSSQIALILLITLLTKDDGNKEPEEGDEQRRG